jgi:cystathionine beta-lyase/cystathionine gamma-synthase
VKFSTRAIHVGQETDPTTGATITPIYQTATYTQEAIGKHKGYEYSRTGNPTRAALEMCLASLEKAEYGLAFASGLAATTAVLSLLRPGDHVLAAHDLYGGTYRLFEKVCSPQGISFTYVDGREAAAFERAARPETRLLWIETPTNPLLQLVDIAAVAEIARARGALLAVDNTFATPYWQRPLSLGAHIVVHSTTKYISGHLDVVGGAVLTSDGELYHAIKFYQNAAGGVPGPFDCWLTLRGLKTLAVRMRQHEVNARQVADYLVRHPLVAVVHYPGLADHPQHELACRQMGGFGGMVSFTVKGGRDGANAFVSNLRVFSLAESLGGVESLACYPPEMTHGSIPAAERQRRGITEGMIRLSIGIEDIEDLIADLEQALEHVPAIHRGNAAH